MTLVKTVVENNIQEVIDNFPNDVISKALDGDEEAGIAMREKLEKKFSETFGEVIEITDMKIAVEPYSSSQSKHLNEEIKRLEEEIERLNKKIEQA